MNIDEQHSQAQTSFDIDLFSGSETSNDTQASDKFKETKSTSRKEKNNPKQRTSNKKDILPFSSPYYFSKKPTDSKNIQLIKLYQSLKNEAKLIDEKTSDLDFLMIFSENKINNPVIWLASNPDLKFLIQYLLKRKIIKCLYQKHWIITSKCFIKKKGDELEKYEVKDFSKNNDKSLKKDIIKSLIDDIFPPPSEHLNNE